MVDIQRYKDLLLRHSPIIHLSKYGKSLYKEKKPIKVAAVRNSKIVGTKEIDIEEIRKNTNWCSYNFTIEKV